MNANFKASRPNRPESPTMELWNCDSLKWDQVYDVRSLDKDQAREYIPLIQRETYDRAVASGKSPYVALLFILAR